MCLPKILFPVFMFAFNFSLALYYLAASISHFLTAAMKFSCFSSNKIHLPSSFSVIHVSVNIKNNVEKGSTLLFFFSLKVRAAMRFSSVAVGCHICRLSYFALHLVRLLTSSFYFALFSSLICVVRDCAHTVGGSS